MEVAMLRVVVVGACVLAAVVPRSADGEEFAFQAKAAVQAPTRLDWTVPLTGVSLAEPPPELLDGYVSTRQRYNLYGPRRVTRAAYPFILFVSYRSTSYGWEHCRPTCVRNGVIYAEPLKAGNQTPPAKRIRIVMDVLDDVRRRFPIDPDRTYIMGYSGGGAVADRIARALPEYFGGVLISSHPSAIPGLPWQLKRMKARLSVALHAGGRESFGFDVGKVNGPIYTAVGIRTRYRVHPQWGHHMVPPAVVEQTYHWLEAGLPARQALAVRYPASRVATAISRREWADALLAEARQRLQDPRQIVTGLEQLQWIARRWADLPAGRTARELFDDYQSREPRPWVAEAKAARLKLTQTLAEHYERLAQAANLGLSRPRRATLARGAITNWNVVIRDSDDAQLVARAQAALPVLKKIAALDPSGGVPRLPAVAGLQPADGKRRPAKAPHVPARFTVSLSGLYKLDQLVDFLQPKLAQQQIELVVEKRRIDRDRSVVLRVEKITVDQLLAAALPPLGLDYSFQAGKLTIKAAR